MRRKIGSLHDYREREKERQTQKEVERKERKQIRLILDKSIDQRHSAFDLGWSQSLPIESDEVVLIKN